MNTPHVYIPGKTGFTILALHETGANEDDLPPIARAVAPGAAVLSPRVDGSSPLSDMAAWVAARIHEYALDPARVYALGYSTGADVAANLMMQHPGLLAGGVLLRPGNLARPGILPPLESVSVLVIAGTKDTTHPPDSAIAVARLLAEAGASVDFSEHDSDHGLTPHDFALGREWLSQRFNAA